MMTDKDLEKLIKKSSRKKLMKATGLSSIIILIVILGSVLSYNNHYNKWPFNKEKIAGVPDNTLIKLEEKNQLNNLLFPAQESLLFNAKGNKAVVYMEKYEKENLVKTTELASLSADTAVDSNLYGSVQWGMIDWGLTEDNVRVALSVNKNEATNTVTVKPKKGSVGTNTGPSYDSNKLEKNQPLLIGFWGAGEDSAVIANYDFNGFDQEELKENLESFALFFEIR